MSYTLHEEQAGEAKSKNSNIDWCVRHCVPTLLENEINMDNVFVTIIDADSLIPYVYVDRVNKHISENFSRRHKFLYQPPQVFTRNDKDCYFFVRLCDIIMSYMQTSSLYSICNYTIGVSNYTVSYRHLERIGFWDTCEFSRTEDFRIGSKSYWKTKGDFYIIPIITPFNQLSLSTGQGWYADLNARFEQAIRHGLSQIEVSYNLFSFLRSDKTLKDCYVLFIAIDVYFCVGMIPLVMITNFFQHVLPLFPHAQSDDGTFFIIYNILNIIGFLIAFPFYEATKRRVTKEIYKMRNMSLWHLIPLPFLVSPIAIAIGFIPLVMGGFRLMCGMKYVHQVAPKLVKNKPIDTCNEILEFLHR